MVSMVLLLTRCSVSGAEPFYETEVEIRSSIDGAVLSGTLAVPESDEPKPAVLLIQGSGPLDRDETVFGHAPFKDISNSLAAAGCVVLRMDRRGVGRSEGIYRLMDFEIFKNDSYDAFKALKGHDDTDPDKTGILGHSLGAFFALNIAQLDSSVSSLILMTPSGIWGKDIIEAQNLSWAVHSGLSEDAQGKIKSMSSQLADIICAGTGSEREQQDFCRIYENIARNLSTDLRNMFYPGPADLAYRCFTAPEYRNAMAYEPVEHLKAVSCPILVLLGDKDPFVPFDVNFPIIKGALQSGCTSRYEIKMLEDHNHHLQKCQTGHPGEMAGIRESVSQTALEMICDWVR